MRLKIFITLFIGIFCLINSTSIFAQVAITARVRTFDVQQYILRSKFDRNSKTYFGDSTIIFKPLKDGFNTLTLDSTGIKYDSIVLESTDKTLVHKQIGDKISITLDKSYSPNETISIRFKYSTRPKKGVYFVDEEKGVHSSQVWTQGEAEEAHYWFPSYDFPDDKALTEQFITTEKMKRRLPMVNY